MEVRGSDETALGYVGRCDGHGVMTDKAFYQAAAAEVADGVLDRALWIKVNAELPGASDVVQQAKYVQFRAEELARAARSTTISRLLPRTGPQWALCVVIAVGVALIFGALTSSGGAFSLVLAAEIVTGAILQAKYGEKSASASAAPLTAAPTPSAPVMRLPPPQLEQSASTPETNPTQSVPLGPAAGLGLAKAYWLFQMIPALILSIVIRNVLPPLALFLFFIFVFYELFALPAVWNAAGKYPGPKIWAVIAKIGVVGAIPSLAVSALLLIAQATTTQVTASVPTVDQASAAAPAPSTSSDQQAIYDREVADFEQRYPEINPDSPHYNAALTKTMLEKDLAYEAKGLLPSYALTQAVNEVMSARKRNYHVTHERKSNLPSAEIHSSQACNYDSVMSDAKLRACGAQVPGSSDVSNSPDSG